MWLRAGLQDVSINVPVLRFGGSGAVSNVGGDLAAKLKLLCNMLFCFRLLMIFGAMQIGDNLEKQLSL